MRFVPLFYDAQIEIRFGKMVNLKGCDPIARIVLLTDYRLFAHHYTAWIRWMNKARLNLKRLLSGFTEF